MSLLLSIADRLDSLGYEVHIGRADAGSELPYIVINAPADGRPDEEQLSGPVLARENDVRVTVAAGTQDGVATILGRVRARLSPGKQWSKVPTPGWDMHLRYERSEFIATDTSTTIAETNRHPAWGVDTYHLVAELDGSLPPDAAESAAGGQSNVWTQSEPLAQWVIPHGLNRIPAVSVYIDGEEVDADISATTTSVTISFPAPMAGLALLT